MEKTTTIERKMMVDHSGHSESGKQVLKDRRDHLKVWREIYQDVRRQWAEAENYSPRGGRYGK